MELVALTVLSQVIGIVTSIIVTAVAVMQMHRSK
jgi:hypothetical protein